MQNLKFRQIHLDFHTSPEIDDIGVEFDKEQWQNALKLGHVDSITCFATGHHGWSYYDTKLGRKHPHLSFDLLRAQFDATKEIGVNVPIYLTAGVHNMIAEEHPEWREIERDGKFAGWTDDLLEPGFRMLCFNSPYLDYLCKQIEEVVSLFPNADGIFLDIISQSQCYCRWCMESMLEKGFNPEKEEERLAHAKIVLHNYYERTTAVARINDANMPVFHNSGHIQCGNRDILKHFSHLELESLPTGGWGYDHFPISAKYCHKLEHDFLGMTGKFHTTWGEFGGYKHPNALRYECASMLAYGAKCSVGDQLHPSGKMDMSTYKLIGEAYAEVASKEKWCINAENVADIALLSSEAVNKANLCARDDVASDIGAGRILLEGHFLFDVLDTEMDFSKYKVLILPDEIKINNLLKTKIDEYLAGGGKLLLTGSSGLAADGSGFLFDVGAKWEGENEYSPDYILTNEELRPSFIDSPLVMYLPSQKITLTNGQSLGEMYNPYFNRQYEHFCSHQHAPPQTEPSGFACGVRNGNILYLAHPVFSIYRGFGAVAYKEYIINAINSLLGKATLKVGLPSTARVSLMKQADHKRYVLHLLYANTIKRGGPLTLSGGTVSGRSDGVEVIDELVALYNVKISLMISEKIKSVICVPSGDKLIFEQSGNEIRLVLPRLECHQMIQLTY
ncbi:MAG: hypothetical protein KOO69_03600 [Victivallales bacterium]|nr:hypothetical protein [Victivallales bacterium]